MTHILAAAFLIFLIESGEAGIALTQSSIDRQNPSFSAPPSNSTLGNFTSAAVTSDVDVCSQIGR